MKAKCSSRQLTLHIISKGKHKENIKAKIIWELLQQERIMSRLINLSDGKEKLEYIKSPLKDSKQITREYIKAVHMLYLRFII